MAYLRKVKGGWRAEVERAGVRTSATRETKAAAAAWAAAEEAVILSGSRGTYPEKTLSEAFRRYEREVSKNKRGARAENLRFGAFERLFPELSAKTLHTITTADLVQWREARMAVVSPSSVLREATQLRNVWTVAADEWHWTASPSPWSKLKLPAKGHARANRTGWATVRRLLRHMGYRPGRPPTTPQQEVAYAYLVAQHTAMRAGEVQGLSRSSVDLVRRVVRLDEHKTVEAEGRRFVPLFPRAIKVLRVLDAQAFAQGRDAYFTVSSQSIDVLFRKVRDRLLLKDALRFHDSRADALTRMSRKVDVLTLAKISGHRDLNQLLDAYYRETPAQIAARL